MRGSSFDIVFLIFLNWVRVRGSSFDIVFLFCRKG